MFTVDYTGLISVVRERTPSTLTVSGEALGATSIRLTVNGNTEVIDWTISFSMPSLPTSTIHESPSTYHLTGSIIIYSPSSQGYTGSQEFKLFPKPSSSQSVGYINGSG